MATLGKNLHDRISELERRNVELEAQLAQVYRERDDSILELGAKYHQAIGERDALLKAIDVIPTLIMQKCGPPYNLRFSVDAFEQLCKAIDQARADAPASEK